MQAWVEYCNRAGEPAASLRPADQQAQPLNVRYWSIGNENWGGHEIGARTPQEWGPLVLKSAELMRAADPDVKLLAAATPSRDWTLPLLKTAGNQLDYVAIHEYWLPCWGNNVTPDYLTCVSHSDGPERTIRRVIDLLEESGQRGRARVTGDASTSQAAQGSGAAGPAAEPFPPTLRRVPETRSRSASGAVDQSFPQAMPVLCAAASAMMLRAKQRYRAA